MFGGRTEVMRDISQSIIRSPDVIEKANYNKGDIFRIKVGYSVHVAAELFRIAGVQSLIHGIGGFVQP